MALDLSLATAKKAAKAVGATKPADYPGDENAWVVDWFTQGVNAGDARLLKFADPNATVSEGGGEKDLITDYQNAAPSSEWLGKRKPTARELRRYAIVEKGGNYFGEDFARNPDRVLADWINKSWDVAKGGFFTSDGTQVAKPPDQHQGSWVQGWEPGGQYRGGSAPSSGGGGGAAPATPSGATSQVDYTSNDLQNALINLFNQRGGIFGTGQPAEGATPFYASGTGLTAKPLAGGALWWGPQGFDTGQYASEPVLANPPAPSTPTSPVPTTLSIDRGSTPPTNPSIPILNTINSSPLYQALMKRLPTQWFNL